MAELVDVVAVVARWPLRLELRFSDGFDGTVDLGPRLQGQGLVAEIVESRDLFLAATVDRERGVVCWPNGLDFDSDVLRAWADGREGPEWA